MKNIRIALVFFMLLTVACADLDANVHNRRHCTVVTDDTCNDKLYWDRLCTQCDDTYDFNREYEWFEGMLNEGESVRDILSIISESQIPTEDGEGTLFAYFIPSHGENAALANTTIVYNNGNFANIEHYIPRMRFFHNEGYNQVVWDYRGYGKSLPDAEPTPDQFLSDARSIWDYAKVVAPDATKMISYGYSLGGIPSVEMALSNEQCALMLEAVFPSIALITESASTLTFGESFFSAGKYDNEAKLKKVTQPTFVFHGDADVKFHISASEALYAAAAGPKDFWTVPDTGHSLSTGGIPEAGLTEYMSQLRTFLDNYAPGCLTVPTL
jgi:pimeloyl-ACP methyl ester carboxylesterase